MLLIAFIVAIFIAQTLYGMVLIASATRYMGADGIIRYVGVQGAAMALGLCAYVFMSMIDVEIVMGMPMRSRSQSIFRLESGTSLASLSGGLT